MRVLSPWLGAALVPFVLAACGGHVVVDQPGGAGGSGAGGAGTGITTGTGGGSTSLACNEDRDVLLAVNQLRVGDTNPDGAESSSAWKQYGLDLDGRASTKTSTDLCKPVAAGNPANVYPDGNDGIDNAFGKNILPILKSLSSEIALATNQDLAGGNRTILLQIERLGAATTCSATTKLFLGGDLGKPAAFDGSDVWPIDASSVQNPGDPGSALNVFAKSEVQDDAFHSGPEARFDVTLTITTFPHRVLRLPLRHARIEMRLDADHGGATGVIGAIMDTEELVQAVTKAAGSFDQSLCDPSSPTLQSILTQFRQASDILNDGTQDPAKQCNGISVGLGFTMRAVELGPVAKPAKPSPDPCGPKPPGP